MNFEKGKQEYLLLSCQTRAILLGSVLGDGSLRKRKNSLNRNASFWVRHSIKQKEYFLWKRDQLKKELSFNEVKDIYEQFPNPSNLIEFSTHKLCYRSKSTLSLTYFYHLVTKLHKKCIKRKWLNMMTPLSLAIWWCDDGSLVKNTRQGVFCTEGFSFKEIQVLQKYLDKVWKIKTVIYSQNKFKKDGQERYRLWIVGVSELKKFLRLIIPHIPVSSMLYKVLILYKDSDLQQRWISEIAANSKFSMRVVEDLAKKRKSEIKAFI
jgi:hypothetical protein